MAIVGGSAACFSSQRHSDKPCHVTVNRIGLGQDSLEIYFAKRFKNGSEAVEVRKVPVSNLQTFCGYGIVAEETDAKQRLIDAAADSLKIVFRVEGFPAEHSRGNSGSGRERTAASAAAVKAENTFSNSLAANQEKNRVPNSA